MCVCVFVCVYEYVCVFIKVLITAQSAPKTLVRVCVCVYGHTYNKSMDQPGKVANPARGRLNR